MQFDVVRSSQGNGWDLPPLAVRVATDHSYTEILSIRLDLSAGRYFPSLLLTRAGDRERKRESELEREGERERKRKREGKRGRERARERGRKGEGELGFPAENIAQVEILRFVLVPTSMLLNE